MRGALWSLTVGPVLVDVLVVVSVLSDSVHSLSRRRLLTGLPALLGAASALRAQELPERPRLRLAVGGKTALNYLPLALAEQLQYFKNEGLELELQDHAGGALAQQSMVQGHADLAAGGFEHPLVLHRRGLACRAFVFLSRAPQMVFGISVRRLPGLQDAAQLKGRRIGISAAESATHWFARLVLARAGVQPSEVEFVDVGNTTAAATALREGRIDAIANVEPVISMLEFRGELRVLADTRSLRGTQQLYGGPMPGSCLYARQDFVQRFPRTVQAVTNAVVRSLKWLQTAGPSDIVRAVPEAHMYGDRAIYLAALEKVRESFSPDGLVSDDGVAVARRVIIRHDASPAAVGALDPGATYTNEFVRRAKQRYQALVFQPPAQRRG